jgi:hypothetical protein
MTVVKAIIQAFNFTLIFYLAAYVLLAGFGLTLFGLFFYKEVGFFIFFSYIFWEIFLIKL